MRCAPIYAIRPRASIAQLTPIACPLNASPSLDSMTGFITRPMSRFRDSKRLPKPVRVRVASALALLLLVNLGARANEFDRFDFHAFLQRFGIAEA